MKKLFTSVAVCLTSALSFGQIGAVAPDFTVTDTDGNSHTLYSYLNAGKVVLLDVSATWCGPCWNFHNAHYLEDLYAEYGPAGTNEVVVLFYEGDAATNSNDLNGSGSNTQGDWVTGTPYPIVNESPLQLNLNIFAPLGFPTINVICPSDKKIKADLWDSQVSGNQAASLQNMRTVVQNNIDNCAMAAGITEQTTLEASIAPNPTSSKTSIRVAAPEAGKATVNVYGVSGKLIAASEHSLESGANTIELDLNGLEAGTYFVQISNEHTDSKMIPVVKQ